MHWVPLAIRFRERMFVSDVQLSAYAIQRGLAIESAGYSDLGSFIM